MAVVDGPVVAVRDLRMRYGPTDVLTGVDFDVRRGEVVTQVTTSTSGRSAAPRSARYSHIDC
jgi:ABC-2 type transport system ATP-binding protein